MHADYRGLVEILRARGLERVDGIVADLGVSSFRSTKRRARFSFQQAGPLDMRMDRCGGTLAGDSRGSTRKGWRT